MIMQSDNITNLTKALILAVEEIGAVIKESDNQRFRYANLPTLLRAINPPAHKHGLKVSFTPQLIDMGGRVFVLVTQITHSETGEFMRGVYPLYRDDNAKMTLWQKDGSAQTYAARYTISNMLALPILNEEDTDGEPEVLTKSNTKGSKVPKPPHVSKLWAHICKEEDEEQRKALIGLITQQIGARNINEYTPDQTQKAHTILDAYFEE